MTTPSPADGLRECLALLEKATPGELTVYDANEGDGWPPRPLWCFKNEAYDSDSEDGQPLQGSVHYGGKEDADAIAAAVNLLRTHGPALLAALRLREGCEAWMRRIEREADAHTYFADNADLRMTAGDHAKRAAQLTTIRDDLARVLEQTK